MKQIYLVLVALAIILFFPQAASAATYDTTTTITLPSNINAGQSFDATVQVSYADGDAFVGSVDLYHSTQQTRLGGHAVEKSASTPSLSFVFDMDTDVNFIQIPVTSFSPMSTRIFFAINDGSNDIKQGSINPDSLNSMINQGYLFIAFSSEQDGWSATDQLTFAADTTYTLRLYKSGSTVSISVPTATVYDGSKLYDNGTQVANAFPAMSFHGGPKTQVSYSGSAITQSFTASTGPSFILAYYFDGLDIFKPSLDFITVNPTTSANQLTLNDINGLVANSISLTAQLSPIEQGRPISFYALRDGYYQLLGSSNSAANGIASLSTSFDTSGSFTLMAHTTTGSYLSDTATATISKHPLVLSNLQAIGTYNDLGSGQTTVTISGKATTQSGTALQGITIELYQSSVLISSMTTNALGIFSFTQTLSLSPNTYTDYYNIITSALNYQTQDVLLDLVLSKATPIITYSVDPVDYGEDLLFSGSLSNSASEALTLQVALDEFTGGTWVQRQTQTAPFSFPVSNKNVGTYLFRLRVDETSNYTSKITTMNAYVNPALSQLDRQGLPTAIIAEYHETIDLSIYFLDSNSQNIDGGTVEVYVYNTDNDQQEFLTSVTTVNGLATISWDPTNSQNGVSYFSLPIIYHASHPNYADTTLQITVEFRPTQLTATLDTTSYGYGETPTIVIDTLDDYGYIANQGTTVDVIIEGTAYSTTINSVGEIRFSHTFTNVGAATMTLSLTGGLYPYDAITSSLSYSISKGWYIIASPDVTGIGGQQVSFAGTITDNLGQALSSSVTISAYIYDTQWVLIGSQTTLDSFAIDFSNQLLRGNYNIELRISGNTYYTATIKSLILTNSKDLVELQILSAPSSYLVFSDQVDRYMELQLNNFLGTSLESMQVNYSLNSSTPITGTLVTDAQGKLYYTLPSYLVPGTYSMVFNYPGSAIYTSTSLNHIFQVSGLATTVTWITVPVNTYQGDQVFMEVEVSDTYGILPNHPVIFTINGVDYSATSNAQGRATLSITLREPLDTVDITATADATGAWQSSSISTTITQQHRQLDFTVSRTHAYYGDQIYLSVNTTWQTNSVPNVLIEVYYQSNLVYSGTTNSSGQLRISIYLPYISTGSSYLLNIHSSKLDYLGKIKDASISVTPMPISAQVLADPALFNRQSNISVQILDVYGDPIAGYVTISYSDAQYSYSTTVLINGNGMISFNPFTSGSFVMDFLVFDYANQISGDSGTFSITVAQATPKLSYTFNDTGGVISIQIQVLDGFDQELNMPVEIYIDGFYRTTIQGSDNVSLDFGDQNITIQTASPHVEFTSVQTALFMQEHAIIVTSSTYLVYEDINITLDFIGNASFDGYTVGLAIDGQIWTTTLLSSPSMLITIPNTYAAGTYTLIITLLDQGWYDAVEIRQDIIIEKRDAEINVDPGFLTASTINNLSVSVIDGQGYGGIEIVLFDFSGDELARGITDTNGDAVLSFTYGFSSDIDILSLQILDNPYIVSGYTTLNLPVYIPTTLEISSTQFGYDSGGIINVTLEDNLGNPIDHGQIMVYLGHYNLSTNQFDYVFMTSGYTTTGFISFDLIFGSDYVFINAAYKFRIEYVSIDNYLINVQEFDAMLIKDQLEFSYDIQDFGITNFIEIDYSLFSMGTLIDEQVYYELRVGSTVLSSGYATGAISIAKDRVGTYTLYIRYTDTKTPARYLEYSTSLQLEFSAAKTSVSPNALEFEHGDTMTITVFDENTNKGLQGVMVKIHITGEDTDQSLNQMVYGNFNLTLDLLPGDYIIHITIDESSLYSSYNNETSIIILRYSQQLTVPKQLELSINQSLVIDVSDQPQGSIYQLKINGDEIATNFNGTHLLIAQSLIPGTYNFELIRTNELYQDASVTISVTIKPIEVVVYWEAVSADNGVQFTIFDINSTQFSELPYATNLTVTVYLAGGGQQWTINGSGSLFIPLDKDTTLFLEANGSVWYIFEIDQEFEYKHPDIPTLPSTTILEPNDPSQITLENIVTIGAALMVVGVGSSRLYKRGKKL